MSIQTDLIDRMGYTLESDLPLQAVAIALGLTVQRVNKDTKDRYIIARRVVGGKKVLCFTRENFID